MRSFFAYDGPMMYGLGGLSEYSMKGTKSEGPSNDQFPQVFEKVETPYQMQA